LTLTFSREAREVDKGEKMWSVKAIDFVISEFELTHSPARELIPLLIAEVR
jgi:hypothetical protein